MFAALTVPPALMRRTLIAADRRARDHPAPAQMPMPPVRSLSACVSVVKQSTTALLSCSDVRILQTVAVRRCFRPGTTNPH
jgi:hypothetical protein